MRKQYFLWIYLVTSIVLSIYGSYSIIYNAWHKTNIPLLAIIILSIGGVMLLIFLVLFIIDLVNKKKQPVKVEEPVKEEPKVIEAEEKKEEPKKETPKPQKVNHSRYDDVEYVRTSTSYGGSETVYVKKVGYGPVLRVSGSQILDMRSNTYYLLEGNHVKMQGSGPVFEISGDRIRVAFGSYLYELSGSNVNKVYGGYFASFSGGYLQTHDLSQKYEIDGSLSQRQKLAVVALLFGTY